MKLHIITPEEKRSFNIAWLEAHTIHGSFIIQRGHAPTVLLLAPQKPILFRLKNGKKESIIIDQGIMEVNRTQTTILINKILS